MENSYTSFLYYRALATAILGPVIFYFFINAMTEGDSSNILRIVFYSVIGALMLWNWYVLLKTRKVVFEAEQILIKKYFSDEERSITPEDIINISEAFGVMKKTKGLLYTLEYKYEGTTKKIYFYTFDASSVEDWRKYFGV
jgi:hypothetical protein